MREKRLVIIVEGDCEVLLMNNLLIPYLYGISRGTSWAINVQKITTNRKLNRRGGNVSFQYLKNEIGRVAAQGNVLVTTFLDFFRLPVDFPGYTTDGTKIDEVETAIRDTMAMDFFAPYLQKYEFESLLFSSMDGFNFLLDDPKDLRQIQEIIDSYDTPEDINGGVMTAPSKRLERIFPYNKVTDSTLVLELLDVDTMRQKCPRFNRWVKGLIDALLTGRWG